MAWIIAKREEEGTSSMLSDKDVGTLWRYCHQPPGYNRGSLVDWTIKVIRTLVEERQQKYAKLGHGSSGGRQFALRDFGIGESEWT